MNDRWTRFISLSRVHRGRGGPNEILQPAPGGRIEDAHRAIVAPKRQGAAVGAEGQRLHPVALAGSARSSVSVSAFQILTSRLLDALTSREPSGENAILMMLPVCASVLPTSVAADASIRQARRRLSAPAATST
jgi:hypothetical protein